MSDRTFLITLQNNEIFFQTLYLPKIDGWKPCDVNMSCIVILIPLLSMYVIWSLTNVLPNLKLKQYHCYWFVDNKPEIDESSDC